MNCLITSGYTLGCRDNTGGVKEIYIGQYNGTSLTYTLNNMTIGTFSGATVCFFKFEQAVETASYKEVSTSNDNNGTTSYDQTVEITLWKLNASLKNQIKTLVQGNWRIIVLDNEGIYHFIGADSGARASMSDGGVGKAYADLHGGVLTFTAKNTIPAYEVSSAAALQVIA